MPDENAAHPTQLRVMIADDVMETRRSTRLMLTLLPEAKLVALAHDGRQAVEMAREHKPDIALMDVSMPHMNGVDAIEQMVKENPGIGCIVISAERDKETLRRAMSVGAKGYLIKPITSEELVTTVRRVAEAIEHDRSLERQAEEEHEHKLYLQQMAMQYVKARRTDDEALAVFEELAADPDCDVPWLQSLAVVYVFRQEWKKLQMLAGRLDELTSAGH
jgi:YesN/AraC family two-component response regulator